MKIALLFTLIVAPQTRASAAEHQLNDTHFQLTNYIQEGTDIRKFLDIMGTRLGRVALFGIPLP